MAGKSGSGIQSVERAARILSFFTTRHPQLTLGEITARLDVSRATAHRYVVALRDVNLIRYSPDSGAYTLGPQILTLGGAALAGMPVISVAYRHMEELMRELDETVVLSVWDGDAPVIAQVVDATKRLVTISISTGARLPLFESAQGRIFCAFLSSNHAPAVPRELTDAICGIREHGLAITSDVTAGIRAVAAPVFRGSLLVATLAVVGTATGIPDSAESVVALALRDAAKRLSNDLGHVEEDPAGEK